MMCYENTKTTKTGKVSAICEFCGKTSKPVQPGFDGEPDFMALPIGWSESPFPKDFKHADGSTGSLYGCPSCNKKLHKGQQLKTRNQYEIELIRYEKEGTR